MLIYQYIDICKMHAIAISGKSGHIFGGEWGSIYRKIWKEEGKREML